MGGRECARVSEEAGAVEGRDEHGGPRDAKMPARLLAVAKAGMVVAVVVMLLHVLVLVAACLQFAAPAGARTGYRRLTRPVAMRIDAVAM